jgi:hypothetical protein
LTNQMKIPQSMMNVILYLSFLPKTNLLEEWMWNLLVWMSFGDGG